ncbi:MAG: transporter [Rhizobacter sp.]|nr:transporter [Rhizobacter sp.]
MNDARLACLALALTASSLRAAEPGVGADAPQATPYRPSVSTPAQLSAPGWVEVEAGGLRAHLADGSKRDSVPLTVKLAVTPDWGVRVSTDAWAHATQPGEASSTGGGDTAIVLKRRFALDEASAFGVEGTVSLPTAKSGLGSDGTDVSITGIYSADLPSALHVDLNLVATRLQRTDPGTSHAQWLWAASLSKALDDRWSLTIEPSGTGQHGVESTSQLLGAVSFNASRRLVLDAGLARSLRHGVHEHSVFAGLTWLAARLW